MQQWALVALIGGIISAIALVLYWLFSEKETKPKVSGIKAEPPLSASTPPQELTAPMVQQVKPLEPQALTTPEPSPTVIETQGLKTMVSTETSIEQPAPSQAPTTMEEVVKKHVRRKGRPKGSKRKARAPPSSETS